MTYYSYWLKPIFIVIAIFAFVYLLITLGTSWSVTWTDFNPFVSVLLLGSSIVMLDYLWKLRKKSKIRKSENDKDQTPTP